MHFASTPFQFLAELRHAKMVRERLRCVALVKRRRDFEDVRKRIVFHNFI